MTHKHSAAHVSTGDDNVDCKHCNIVVRIFVRMSWKGA